MNDATDCETPMAGRRSILDYDALPRPGQFRDGGAGIAREGCLTDTAVARVDEFDGDPSPLSYETLSGPRADIVERFLRRFTQEQIDLFNPVETVPARDIEACVRALDALGLCGE